MNTKDNTYLQKNIKNDSRQKKSNNFVSSKEPNRTITSTTKSKENFFNNKKTISNLSLAVDKKQKNEMRLEENISYNLSKKNNSSLSLNKEAVKKQFIKPENNEFQVKFTMNIIRIQRWYRSIIKRRKEDPKYEMKILLKQKKMNILRDYNLISQDKNQETIDSINSFINNEKNSLAVKASPLDENSKGKKNVKENISPDKKDNKKINSKPYMKGQKEEFTKNEIFNEIDIIDIIGNNENEKSNSEEEEENMFENIFHSINKGKANKSKLNQSSCNESEIKLRFNNETEKNDSVQNVAQNIIRNALNNQLNNNYIQNLSVTNEDIDNQNKSSSFTKVNEKEKIVENIKKTDNALKNSIVHEKNYNTSNRLQSESNIEKKDSPEKNRNINQIKDDSSKLLIEPKEIKEVDILFSTNNSNFDLNYTKNEKSNNFYKKDEKFNQIISYLDERNVVCSVQNDNSQVSNKSHTIKQNNLLPTSNPETLNLMVELKESKKTIDTMKIIIEELKNELKVKENHYKNYSEEKINTIKYELENQLNEKNKEINLLRSENIKIDEINKKLEEEISVCDKTYNKKIASIMENFELERKKDKDAWFSAEKARRKKWEDQKLKEIKENTIKGLEPEIEKILQSHKSELFEMEEKLSQELKKQKEKLTNYYEEKLNDYREKYIREKEETLENEKTIFAQRIRNQCDRMENEHNEERRRWASNLNAEISRVELLREKDKKQYEDEIRKNDDRFKKLIDERDSYYKAKISEIENRLNEKNKQEIEDWRMKFEKEKDKFIEEKYKEYEIKFNNTKHEIMKDKEKQLELVIFKLGEETIAERRKIQLECEQKADTINKTLRIENEQLKQKMNELTEKLSAESKVRIMLDDNLEMMSKKIMDLEKDLFYREKKIQELTNTINDLQNKLNNVHIDHAKQKNSLENDLLIKLEKSNNELRVLSEKNESLKNYYESKLSEQKNNYDYQISIIDSKIKKKLESREEIITQLQDDIHLKEIAIQKYEELLAKQRKELLLNN